MELRNKTILITGGTSGIGLELARRLLALGNTVIVTGRDRGRLEAALHGLPGLHGYVSDVSDPQAIEALHAQVLARFPTLDVLVNNAGVMRNIDLAEPRTLVDVTREIDICLSAPIRMVQQFLPHLRTRPQALIVNVSSGLAFIPLAIAPVYCAAKAGLVSFSQSLRAQLAVSNVRVVDLAPPGVETPLLRAEFAREMQGTQGMPLEVFGRSAVSALQRGQLEIRPGLSKVLRALSRIAPGFAFRQMTKRMKAVAG